MTAADWVPGDPLHEAQRDVYVARPIFQLVDDVRRAERSALFNTTKWCEPCGVGWSGRRVTCWVCRRRGATSWDVMERLDAAQLLALGTGGSSTSRIIACPSGDPAHEWPDLDDDEGLGW